MRCLRAAAGGAYVDAAVVVDVVVVVVALAAGDGDASPPSPSLHFARTCAKQVFMMC